MPTKKTVPSREPAPRSGLTVHASDRVVLYVLGAIIVLVALYQGVVDRSLLAEVVPLISSKVVDAAR